MRLFDWILIILFLVCLVAIGWFLNDSYELYKYERKLNGLWIPGVNKTLAKDIASSRDKFGRWVCINVRDMEFEKALETCEHEVAHEIFARFCEGENKIKKCMEITK